MSGRSATLRLISGVGAKGPACFLLEAKGKRLMLDLGEGPPPGLLPNVAELGRLDALILSHGHKDHVGGLSLLPQLGNPPVYASEAVARSLPRELSVRRLPLSGPADVLGIAVETGRNGHAPGGIWLRFDVGHGGVLYTGDYSRESFLYAYDPPAKPTATALIDCSYARYQTPIAACWNALVPLVERGPLLLPVPANGRGPEIALQILRDGHTDIYVDDAMHTALRHLADDGASLRPDVGDDIKCLAVSAKPIDKARGVMLAASADGASGATKHLLAQWQNAAEPSIVFTGYRAPDTPADRLIKSGRAQFLRWNVHPLLSDTVALVRTLQAKTVIPAFCDRAELAGLAEALAPAQVTMDGPVAL